MIVVVVLVVVPYCWVFASFLTVASEVAVMYEWHFGEVTESVLASQFTQKEYRGGRVWSWACTEEG